MMAKCVRISGEQSVVAPPSISSTGLSAGVGMATAMPGRCTPSSVRSLSVQATTAAPVLPAANTASASCFLTRSTAREMEESRLRRIATAGDSPISTTSEAWRISTRPGLPPQRSISACTASLSPTR